MPPESVNTKGRINKQKEIEQRKRKKRKIKTIILLILIIFIAISAYLLNTDEFKIKTINIEGCNNLREEEVYELSEIKEGKSIFSVIETITKVKLKRNGYIEDAKIKKEYPNQILIQVTERQNDFQILTEDSKYIFINEQGYIIGNSEESSNITTITGMEITVEQSEKIKRLEEKDLDKMEDILHIKDEITGIEGLETIERIDTKDEYIIHFNEDKLKINLGNASELSNRMYFVRAILKKEEGNSGTIYVNGNINEQFSPYFRAE